MLQFKHDKIIQDKKTETIYSEEQAKGVSKDIVKKARRRLAVLNRAIQLEDLYFPPSNKLHALSGYEPVRYAIYINKQWRITFEWHEGDAYNVQFEDYH
ncbi:MAG: type II toxin-antitoxin system RelE/ParE family toxin [Desulfobacterales bacterium]|nr:type II toxin-antitoxin system RelE/ParE family toxin [Desulfobacterales bacterium]